MDPDLAALAAQLAERDPALALPGQHRASPAGEHAPGRGLRRAQRVVRARVVAVRARLARGRVVGPRVVHLEHVPEDGRRGDGRDDECEGQAEDVHHRVELQCREDGLHEIGGECGAEIALYTESA